MALNQELMSVLALSEKHIELDTDNIDKKESFIDALDRYFAQLLEQDFEKLMQIMYRIDVPEQEFALTLQPNNDQRVSRMLAEKVYERLLLKVKLRQKYK